MVALCFIGLQIVCRSGEVPISQCVSMADLLMSSIDQGDESIFGCQSVVVDGTILRTEIVVREHDECPTRRVVRTISRRGQAGP